MTSVAHEGRRPGRRERGQHERASRRLLAGGVVWIVAAAVVLAGVVAVNVAELQLNLRVDHVNRQKTQLRHDIASASSKLASARNTARIVAEAEWQAGLQVADPATTGYVTLPH